MQRLPLLVASALLLFIASCNGPADEGLLPPESGISAAEVQEPAADASPESVATEEAGTDPGTDPGTDSAATASPTSTPIPSPTATETTLPPPSPTGTPTLIPSATPSPTLTVTPEPPTPTATPTATAADTPPQPSPTPSLTAAPPQPSPTPTLTAAPTATAIPAAVFVRSHTTYAADFQLVLVGELVNGGPFEVYAVRVQARFFSGSGEQIADAEAPAAFGKLEAERTAPFRMVVDVDPTAVESYELDIFFDEFTIAEYRELEVSAVAVVERGGRVAVVGRLHNPHETALTSIRVAATFYDESGEVAEVVELPMFGETITPGAELPFEIPLQEAGRTYAHLHVQAQGQLSLF